MPSNILIIYLHTYKNKVSKVVILVVIFPDCFDDLIFFPLIISRAFVDLGKTTFFQDSHRGKIFCTADSIDLFDIEFFGHAGRKAFTASVHLHIDVVRLPRLKVLLHHNLE